MRIGIDSPMLNETPADRMSFNLFAMYTDLHDEAVENIIQKICDGETTFNVDSSITENDWNYIKKEVYVRTGLMFSID